MNPVMQEHSQLLIIDATAEGKPTEPEHCNVRLQIGVARALHLSLDVVKAAWTAVDLTQANIAYPVGADYISPLTIYERELDAVESILQQRGQTLKGMQTLLIYDEGVEGCHAIDVGFAVRVFIRTKVAPIAVGFQYDLEQWFDINIIPRLSEQAFWLRSNSVPLEKEGNIAVKSTIVGRCVNNEDLQNFIRKYLFGPEKLFSLSHHVPADELIASLLPGQSDLPMDVWEFQNEQTALIVIEIAHAWVGPILERNWRIIYIHHDLEALFLQEVGSKLHDIPIGENEKNASSLERLDDEVDK